jgi:outer membrane protein
MKKMIFTLAAVVLAACAMPAMAQMKVQKLGYVNSMELLDAMPEKKPADAELEKYGNDLYTNLEKMYNEYQKKVAEFQKGMQDRTLSEIDQEFKANEIQSLEKRISDFQDQAEEKVAKKRQALYSPIIDKINKAIQEVAKQDGYTYIFDLSAGMILYADESENLIETLKKKLNIAK